MAERKYARFFGWMSLSLAVCAWGMWPLAYLLWRTLGVGALVIATAFISVSLWFCVKGIRRGSVAAGPAIVLSAGAGMILVFAVVRNWSYLW